ncbi:MAG: guanine nucleotide exchange protein for ADP-robosylation factor [Pycnora praestabilis]|nr:MAG: guanine nucleotide exchange protein for ADP-robosylation factor [Pycnora praestabilis]
MAEAEPKVANGEQENGLRGEETPRTEHSSPLTKDKEGLSSGQDWMEIKMEDVKGGAEDTDADDEGTNYLTIPNGHENDDGQEESDTEEGAPSESTPQDQSADTPSTPPEREDDPGERQLPPLPLGASERAVPNSDSQDVESAPSQQAYTATNNVAQSQSTRQRSDTQSTVATNGTQRTSTLSSMVFVVTALEHVASSKDARKRKQLGDSVQRALTAIKQTDPPNPEVLFEPLQLATQTTTISLVTTALDCIGKLISYSYFSVPSPTPPPSRSGEPQPPLIERAIETICDCFQGEATPVEVQLQIVKSLLAAVLNDKIVVHGAGLLKAVRQTYNIFLLSKSSANQQVSQGTLTQMVGTVFERVKTRISMKEARLNLSKMSLEKGVEDSSEVDLHVQNSSDDRIESNGEGGGEATSEAASTTASDLPVQKESGEKITLQSFENRKSFDDTRINENAPTMVTQLKSNRKQMRIPSGQDVSSASGHGEEEDHDFAQEEEEDEIYIKDAFLVFRAMCKLSTKTLPAEQVQDLKSHGMRSKLLSLHLIHTILSNNMIVITSPLATIRSSNNDEPTSFVHAIKQYLCLSLSRNGASSVNRVFEVGCEIFWLMLKNMRVMLKKEIEVFLKEIYLAILDKRTTPIAQKQYLMGILERLCTDPRALVEIYLNYDCDRTALDNMFQRIIEHLSRISSTPVAVTAIQQQQYQEQHSKGPNSSLEWHNRGTLPPSLSTASINTAIDTDPTFPVEYSLKQQSLEALVDTLRSLVNWSQQGIADATAKFPDPESRNSIEESRESLDTANMTSVSSPKITPSEPFTAPSTPQLEDDPNQLEKAKQRKTALINGIRQFNFKAKRGIKFLLNEGFIQSDSPEDIALFLIQNDRLDKAMIGEYLGEGEPANVATMHAFVDTMDFTKRRFVDALRQFLQSFRLPGEAQKIDRFMLKFAERYITGNPNAFANADTAYVLAYSVIMLNTDQHSAKLKGPRMTKEDFIKNNRGINDNADLPDDYLGSIYDEIAHNEIVLNTERETAAALGITTQPSGGLAANIGHALATVGRDFQREAYAQASEEMANKTEQLFRSLVRAQRRNATKSTLSKFIPATSFKHVGPMFEVTWMSFLSGISGQMQSNQNIETIRLCMEGLKLAIRIACLFDLETPRVAFVTVLAKFTNLSNLSEMMAKNVEALKVLLEVAQTEGNLLKGSWRDVLICISQLDRFQLISTGVDEGEVPDMSKTHNTPASRLDPTASRRSTQAARRPRPRSVTTNTNYQEAVAQESRSMEIVKGVDRIFTSTANLSGEAIVHFVRALSEVSWQEIQSSGQSDSPRTYSLQKLVEISYYNMARVRFEWTNIWQILGEHFNQVGCHTNTKVVFFALDSLRQLSKRFMEIEELPGFKFQKDFLRPFEHVMANSTVVPVKNMILECLISMIQQQGQNIRSGWRTMFGVFTVAAREPYEGIVGLALDNVTQIYNTRFGIVISQGAFADMVVCLTEFSKNMKFQKKSLQAIETLKSTIPKMLKTPECPISNLNLDGSRAESMRTAKQPKRQTQEEQYWFPILFAFHDVLMTGEDLEVRSRALSYLFDSLIKYGANFPPEFWDILWRQLLYPIFMVLESKNEMSKVLNHEELSVWLSTTMIQALRNMITLFTRYFESLEYMLDRFLDLLTLCICQENDTIARIGSNCLQQLILQNVNKFEPTHWKKIVGAFVELFERTTAYQLFAAATSSSTSSNMSNGASTPQVEGPDTASITDLQMTDTPTQETPPTEDSLKINGLHGPNGSKAGIEEDGGNSSTLTDDASPAMRNTSPSGSHMAVATSELEDYRPQAGMQQQPVVVTAARRRFFNKIITRCVLQLLMIETVNELFSNDAVYAQIPSPELLRLMALLKKSFQFAKKFNGDKDLRMRLWREGFMKQPPNLLKQESGSAATYISILLRMYHDEGEERKRNRVDTESALIPLCVDIIRGYVQLDEESQQRNIIAWRPVVVDVMEGYTNFPGEGFEKHVDTFYPLAVDLLSRDLGLDIRLALQGLLRRIGETRMGMQATQTPLASPTSTPTAFLFGSRRTSSRGK